MLQPIPFGLVNDHGPNAKRDENLSNDGQVAVCRHVEKAADVGFLLARQFRKFSLVLILLVHPGDNQSRQVITQGNPIERFFLVGLEFVNSFIQGLWCSVEHILLPTF